MSEKKENKTSVLSALFNVMRYSRPVLWKILLALLFSAVQIAATLLAPIIIGNTVDYIVGAGNVNFEVIATNALILGALIVAVVVCQYVASLLINSASYGMIMFLRRDAFAKLNRLPLSYIDSRSVGDIMARVGSDVDQISDGLIQGFSQLFSGVVTILGTLGFMYSVNWLLATVVVALTPISLFVAYFIARGCHNMFAMQAQKRGELSGLINETVGAQRVVKLFGYENRAENRFGQINSELKHWGQNAAFYSAMINPCTRFVNNIVYVTVCILGAVLVIAGSGAAWTGASVMTVGALSCFLTYANQYTKPFNEITGVITELQTAAGAADRVFDLLAAPEMSDDSGLPCLESVRGDVTLDNVRFNYDESRPLIEGLSLDVQSGKRVAIVGPTGCGKTTLINLLMRFYDIKGGAIEVDGKNIASVTRGSLRRSYGMVLQETWLKNATVRENIAYGNPSATDEEIIAAAKAARAHGFIEKLPCGYDTVLSVGGEELSQGQRQLLCIARVMLNRPPMLILDEATSSIDTRTEMMVQQAFERLMNGKTSFIVAHRLSTIKSADVILVMRDGNVIEQGSHDELMARGGFYFDLYNAQFDDEE